MCLRVEYERSKNCKRVRQNRRKGKERGGAGRVFLVGGRRGRERRPNCFWE